MQACKVVELELGCMQSHTPIVRTPTAHSQVRLSRFELGVAATNKHFLTQEDDASCQSDYASQRCSVHELLFASVDELSTHQAQLVQIVVSKFCLVIYPGSQLKWKLYIT